MTYEIEVSEQLDKKFKKLAKKNRKQFEIINKKIAHIIENPYHFKPLKGDMKGARRVHIDTSFVLVFEIDEKRKVFRLLDYGHHDFIYRNP